MSKPKEAAYAPISNEHDDEIARIENLHPRPVQQKSNLLQTIIWIEIANLLVFLFLYALYLMAKKSTSYSGTTTIQLMKREENLTFIDLPLDFNTTQTFTINKTDLRYVESGEYARSYWWNITFKSNNGLVVLPVSYANQHNLTLSSLPAPKEKTVFQVDAFHQIHCLDRLRNFITGSKYVYQLNPNMTEEEPFMKHTLHCVDYLRQAIMCNADMTLVSTDRDLEFDSSPERKCRDWGAVTRWVMNHRYDFDKYLNGVETEVGG